MCKESNPCYGCERRCVTSGYNCHSDCPDYKEYHEERVAECALMRKKRLEDADFKGVRIKSIRKSQKAKELQKCYWKG